MRASTAARGTEPDRSRTDPRATPASSPTDERGGNWGLGHTYNNIGNLGNRPPETENWYIGFRVAMIPEPGTAVLWLIGALAGRSLIRRRG